MASHYQPPQFQAAYTTLICDLGDVFFTWARPSSSVVAPHLLNAMLRSPAWEDFERGRITAAECYLLVGDQVGLDAVVVKDAFTAAAESIQPNKRLIAFVRGLKKRYGLSVYAMTNVGQEHAAAVFARPWADTLFDGVFTSCDAGARKPERAFFEHVLAQIKVDPASAIFVDDKAEHVRVANQLGIRGIVFRGNDEFMPILAGALEGATQRGAAYLLSRAGKMVSFFDTGEVCLENFTQFLILELTGKGDWVNITRSTGHRFNYYQGREAQLFPCDLDTTSLAFTTLSHNSDETRDLIEDMLTFRDPDGVFRVYFEHARPRICATACLNILTFLYSEGRMSDAGPTVAYARGVLEGRGYLPGGTRYYPTPDAFLFFACRLLKRAPQLRTDWGPMLKERIVERLGAEGDATSLALRLLACAAAKVENGRDLASLFALQRSDGSWSGWFVSKPSTNTKIGNDSFATVLAMRAILAHECPPVESWAW